MGRKIIIIALTCLLPVLALGQVGYKKSDTTLVVTDGGQIQSWKTWDHTIKALNAKPAVVSSIGALQSYSGGATTVMVTDSLRGGTFKYKPSLSLNDGGLNFSATGKGSGSWSRLFDPATGISVDWFISSSIDTTTAIQNAINSLPLQGGLLKFSAAKYVTHGGITINNNITIQGVNGNYSRELITVPSVAYHATNTGTVIQCTSSTNTLLSVNSAGCTFSGITLVNTSSTTPTAGYGLYMPNGGSFRVNNCTIEGFYINMFADNSFNFVIDGFMFQNPVLNNLIIQGTKSPDTGDNSISNGQMGSNSASLVTAFIYHSSGGLKISNLKINPTYGGRLLNGIDANITGSTSDFQMTNTSIEGFSGSGVIFRHASGNSFSNVQLSNVQFLTATVATGNAVSTRGIKNVNINNCVMVDGYGTTGMAISIDSASYVTVKNNQYPFWTNKLSVTNSVGIIDTVSVPNERIFLKTVALNTDNVIFSTPASYVKSGSTSTGTLSLKTQLPNTFLMGPASGSTSVAPTFRKPAALDLYPIWGAVANATVADFNDVSNTKPGFNPLILSTGSNSPGGPTAFYTPYIVENGATKDGTNNMFEMLLPYTNSAGSDVIWTRLRQSGTWTTWRQLINDSGTQTLSNKTLASPALTGTPTAPTASAGTNTTQLATTAHVFANYAALAGATFTGGVTATSFIKSGATATNFLRANGTDADFSATARGVLLTGLSSSNSAIAATDNILSGFGKAQGQIDAINSGTIAKPSSPATGSLLYYNGSTWVSSTITATSPIQYSSSTNTISFDSSVIPTILTASASLNFPATTGGSNSDLTLTVTGAAIGDVVAISVPTGAVMSSSCFTAWVSNTDQVTIRFNNYGSSGASIGSSQTFKVKVFK